MSNKKALFFPLVFDVLDFHGFINCSFPSVMCLIKFEFFTGVLARLMSFHKQDPTSKQVVEGKPTLLRALFTVGLLCRHFDFDSEAFGEKRVKISISLNNHHGKY